VLPSLLDASSRARVISHVFTSSLPSDPPRITAACGAFADAQSGSWSNAGTQDWH